MDKKEAATQYLKNPDQCPYCGNGLTMLDNLEMGSSDAWRGTVCDNPACSARFTECFVLKTVEIIRKGKRNAKED